MNNVKILKVHSFLKGLWFFAPIMPIYFANVSGSFTLGMSVFAISAISSAIFEIPTGIFSDRVGRKTTIMYGSLASFLSILLYALAPSYIFLVIGAVLSGLAGSFFSGTMEALIYESIDKKNNYQKIYGNISSLSFLAFAISGSIFSFWLLSSGGIEGLGQLNDISTGQMKPFLYATLAPMFGALLTTLFLKEPLQKTKKFKNNLLSELPKAFKIFRNNKQLRYLTLAEAINSNVGEAGFQFRNNFFITTGFPVWGLGLLSLLDNITASIGHSISHKISERFKAVSIFTSTHVYSRISNILVGLSPHPFGPILLSANGIIYGVKRPATNSIYQEHFEEDLRATMGSLIGFLGSIVFAIASLLIGLIADLTSERTIFILTQIILIPVIFLYLKAFNKPKPRS